MSAISVVMGSKSDWPTVKEACRILDQFGVDYDKQVISAHRMPQEMFAFAQGAVAAGTKVIIACAGGDWDSGSDQGPRRDGFTPVYRSDASWDSRCYHCHWGRRGQECRPARFTDPGD